MKKIQLIAGALLLACTSAFAQDPQFQLRQLTIICAEENSMWEYIKENEFGKDLLFYGENFSEDVPSATIVSVHPESNRYAVLFHDFSDKLLCVIADGRQFGFSSPIDREIKSSL